MTSPSSILAYGEAAIRNYLLGNNWMRGNLPGYRDTDENKKELKTIWIPDSFGIDPNAPALIRALGLQGFGNSRFGGNPTAYDGLGATYDPAIPKTKNHPKVDATYTADKGSPIDELLENTGFTFRMIASDSSETIAHFMVGGYNTLTTGKTHKDDAGMTYTDYKIDTLFFSKLRGLDTNDPPINIKPYSGLNALQAAWEAQNSADKTKGTQKYMHVSDDMMWPCVTMQDFIDQFNKDNDGVVKACQSSFDVFIAAVLKEKESLKSLENFQTTPYMDGYYSACPDLKAGHLEATNTLVAAEAFLTLLSKHITSDILETYLKAIYLGWENLVPSTHHAYVTGLSTREVYINEQRPYLFYPNTKDERTGDDIVYGKQEADIQVPPGGKGALTLGKEVLHEVLTTIASQLSPNPTKETQKIAVFNPVGLSQERLVEVAIDSSNPFLSTDFMSTRGNAVQLVPNGETTSKALFFADPSSFGHQSVQLSTKKAAPILNPMTTVFSKDSRSVTITNGDLVVVLGEVLVPSVSGEKSTDIAITSMTYKYKEVLKNAGNALHFYNDSQGSSFQFSYEKNEGGFLNNTDDVTKPTLVRAILNIETAIVGPLKVEIETTSVYRGKVALKDKDTGKTVKDEDTGKDKLVDKDFTYVRTYTFIAGEPFVRMRTKGSAPHKYSVFVDFPLMDTSANGYEQMAYGTPYHWTQQPTQPQSDWKPYGKWDGPYLKGSWHFAMGIDSDKNTSAAIYHKGVPGWGMYNNNKNITGCLFRRVPAALNLWAWDQEKYPRADLDLVDIEEHTLEYAFRVPGVQLPDVVGSEHPMFESMAYQNDLIGVVPVPENVKQPMDSNQHVAMLEKVNENTMGVLTAVRLSSPSIERGQKGKENSLIMRVYQPWNKQVDVSLSLDSSYKAMQEVSALETAIETSCTITTPVEDSKTNTSDWKISPKYAITTLKVENH
ncbi:MAG: alpha-mannosidase [Dokdonia sp.]